MVNRQNNNIKLINNRSNNNKKVKKSKKPQILNLKHIFEKYENLIDEAELLNPDDQLLETKNKLLESKKEFGKLSGSELEYNPNLWNSDDDIKTTHNCYTYALGKIVKGLDSKAQPGYASAYNHIEDNDYKCSSFYKRLKKDVPGSYLQRFDDSCLPGFYKIFLALDPGNDYHWWRQNSDAYWSHKPGSTDVVDVDAAGNKIKNPVKANRNYSSLNYYKPCFFACVNSDLARSLANIYPT
jgi:hypothetical protein